jgi:hypothetical protein
MSEEVIHSASCVLVMEGDGPKNQGLGILSAGSRYGTECAKRYGIVVVKLQPRSVTLQDLDIWLLNRLAQ